MASIYNTKGNKIVNGQYINLRENSLIKPSFDWEYLENYFYLVIIYDIDANNYIHYLVIDIPGMSLELGKEIYDYQPPDPPKGPPHQYIYAVYRLDRPIEEFKIISIDELNEKYQLVDSVEFRAGFPSKRRLSWSEPLEISGNEPLEISGNEPLEISGNEPLEVPAHEEKYCNCVLKVAAKQSRECLDSRKWKEKDSEGKTCYNPYAVCAASTRSSSRQCGKYYHYEKLTDQYLRAYAQLNHIPLPVPYNRLELLQRIEELKRSE